MSLGQSRIAGSNKFEEIFLSLISCYLKLFDGVMNFIQHLPALLTVFPLQTLIWSLTVWVVVVLVAVVLIVHVLSILLGFVLRLLAVNVISTLGLR